MSGLLIGYAPPLTEAQDLTAQRNGLPAFGVETERIHVDHAAESSGATSETA